MIKFDHISSRKAVEGTKWANMTPLLECRFKNAYAFSKEPLIKEFVKVTKDMRLMVPLGKMNLV